MSVNNCEFFNNKSGGTISASYFGYNSISKIKFTNNVLYNNHGGRVMSSLFTDSTIIYGNKFYDNDSTYGIFYNSSYNDETNNVLIFEKNEMYNNHVSDNAAIFSTQSEGLNLIRNNQFHHNTTTLKGAVSVQSKTAIIEGNLIANNNRSQKDGFFCGINDGGAGLHLLGSTVLFDEPDMNIFTVRNNIIANNYSDLDGAGIWANHCKVNIVNNTIINNQSKDPGAAIHGWGQHCNVNVQNNIIYGNNIAPAGIYDTGYYNFNFSPVMQNVNIAHNLIDYVYSNAPANILGLNLNSYDHNVSLTSPTSAAGTSFDATIANFEPTQNSLNIINKGNNSVLNYGTLDYLGNPRIVGSSIDFGAIEYSKDIGNSVYNINLSKRINLYPIPATHVINLENKTGKSIKNVSIITFDGRQLFTVKKWINDVLTIDVSKLSSGSYFVQMTFKDGQVTAKPFSVL